MSEASEYDFIVIRGGEAGIAVSKAASLRGAKTLLIEKSLLGGSGIWSTSVPMKALIQVAKHAYYRQRGHLFGLPIAPIALSESSGALAYVREMTRRISSLEDVSAQCEKAKVDVLEGDATFTGHDRIKVNGRTLKAKNFVLCTGAHPLDSRDQGA